jgi:hypothetical protein
MQNESPYLQLVMPKPSPQFLLSAAASALAMAALALSGPSIGRQTGDRLSPLAAVAGTDLLSLPAFPAFLPR